MAVVILGGLSGVGKTAVVDELTAKFGQYRRPTAYTTRARRDQDGNQFVYVNEEEIYELSKAGELLSLDRVHGKYYGLSRSSVVSLINDGFIPIKEFFIGNHGQLKAVFPGVISIILSPASHSDYVDRAYSDPLLTVRMAGRAVNEKQVHQDYIASNDFDLILINDFRESIASIAERLHKKVATFIEHSKD